MTAAPPRPDATTAARGPSPLSCCSCGCGLPVGTGSRFRRGHNLNRPLTAAEKFRAHVKKGDGCREWTGSLATAGYGRVNLGGRRRILAHRLSYELHVGPVPAGLFVRHHCDNRSCVNPAHLFLGTNQDNMDDMWAKGRGPDPRGERNGRAKVTAVQVAAIRARRAAGESSAALAAEFGVTRSAVWQIVRGRSWASGFSV
jgi:hypothetical protein